MLFPISNFELPLGSDRDDAFLADSSRDKLARKIDLRLKYQINFFFLLGRIMSSSDFSSIFGSKLPQRANALPVALSQIYSPDS